MISYVTSLPPPPLRRIGLVGPALRAPPLPGVVMDDRGFKGSPCYVLVQYNYEGEVE